MQNNVPLTIVPSSTSYTFTGGKVDTASYPVGDACNGVRYIPIQFSKDRLYIRYLHFGLFEIKLLHIIYSSCKIAARKF